MEVDVKPKKGPKFIVEFSPAWDSIRKDILKIDRRAFAGHASDEDNLRATWMGALFTAVLRKVEPVGEAIGYCIVVMSSWPDAAYINYTAIRNDYQGKGLVGILIDAVEDELRTSGFPFMSRDCRIDNGYADKVEKHYGDRIVAKYDHASRMGPLRFFRIKL